MTELAVVIIADDLTGAMDAAAPFARHGLLTRVLPAPENLPDSLARGDLPAVLAINIESRHLPAAEAAARMKTVCAALLPREPRVLFKKIDSTLRGNVVDECLAARRASGRPLLIAPAVPSQGRTLRDGHIYVHGEPLVASDYGYDARSTPPTEPLRTLFARRELNVRGYSAGQALEATDCVVDAISGADLEITAHQLLEAPQRWLAVGAAGLAEAIAAAYFPGALSSQVATLGPIDSLLMAVGSRCAQARRQVDCLREAVPDLAVVYAMAGIEPCPAESHTLLIPEREPSSRYTAEQVAQQMARCIAEWASPKHKKTSLLFLTGGDTAVAVMQRMRVRQIEVAGEWAPGIAWGWLESDRRRPVLTKAGGFGDDSLLVRLHRLSTTRG